MREVSGQIPENHRQLVDSILGEVTGLKSKLVEPISGLGMNNAVTLANTLDGRFVIRTNVESHLFRYQREAWCYNELKDSSVLTPDVIGCGIINAHSYSVAHFIEGSAPVTDELDQIRVWRKLGYYASHLNKIQRPIGEPAKSYFPVSWEEQVQSDLELIFKGSIWTEREVVTPKELDRLREYLFKCADSSQTQGVCQFDMTQWNCVIQNSDYERIFLLDLESANIAPAPHYQLACIAAEKGPDADTTKAYFEGYGVTQEDPELNRFILYRVMRATAWARDRQPQLIDENIRRSKLMIAKTFSEGYA